MKNSQPVSTLFLLGSFPALSPAAILAAAPFLSPHQRVFTLPCSQHFFTPCWLLFSPMGTGWWWLGFLWVDGGDPQASCCSTWKQGLAEIPTRSPSACHSPAAAGAGNCDPRKHFFSPPPSSAHSCQKSELLPPSACRLERKERGVLVTSLHPNTESRETKSKIRAHHKQPHLSKFI